MARLIGDHYHFAVLLNVSIIGLVFRFDIITRQNYIENTSHTLNSLM